VTAPAPVPAPVAPAAPAATAVPAAPAEATEAAAATDLQTWQATGMAKVALETASQPPARASPARRVLLLALVGALLAYLYLALCPAMACLEAPAVEVVAPVKKGFKLKLPWLK